MTIRYRSDARPGAAEYIALLEAAGIAHRRPVDKPEVIQAAIDGAQLVVTAWEGDVLVGALRAITDFHVHCYVCEIAVKPDFQRGGIGLELQRTARAHLGPECRIKLSSTRDAASYYPRVGYERVEFAWELRPATMLRATHLDPGQNFKSGP